MNRAHFYYYEGDVFVLATSPDRKSMFSIIRFSFEGEFKPRVTQHLLGNYFYASKCTVFDHFKNKKLYYTF